MPGKMNWQKFAVKQLQIISSWSIGGVAVTATAAEINKLAGNGVTATDLTKLHAVTADAAELSITDGLTKTAAELNSGMMTKSVSFTETAGAGTYTGAIAVPAGARIEDVYWVNDAAWTNTGTAVMNAGDTADPDGIFAAVDVKTAPAAGNFLSSKRKDTGVGAYGGTKSLLYPTGDTITATVVTSSTGGGAGRSRLIVTYYIPAAGTAATKA